MEAREKAKELMIKMLGFEPKDWNDIHLELDIIRDIYEAKLNSLICVDEKIETLKMVNEYVGLEHTWEYKQFYEEELKELEEVKQEIEKL